LQCAFFLSFPNFMVFLHKKTAGQLSGGYFYL